MFKFWKKQSNTSSDSTPASDTLTWSAEAESALNQAVAQAPVPAMMKGMVKKELQKAGEEAAQKAGHTSVTPEDLMTGLMAKLPPAMKSKVENAMKKGPAGMKDLENELKK